MSKQTLPKWLTITKAGGFPTGWCALTDRLAVRVAKDFKQFRPTAVHVFVAKSRRRMVIRVSVRPRATADVLKQGRDTAREFAALAAETPHKIVEVVSEPATQAGHGASFSTSHDPVARETESRQRSPDDPAPAPADTESALQNPFPR